MKESETVKIMAMLSAFYGQGKSDTEIMSRAWHLILKDYDFHEAERAVIEYAKNDIREYASFPTPGSIVAKIEGYREERRRERMRIWRGMYDRKEYDSLPNELKRLCPQDVYERGLKLDYETLLEKQSDVIGYLTRKQIEVKNEN